MFSKMNTKTLVVLLVVLGVIFYFAVFSDNNDSSYRAEVVNIDTANVTEIIFKNLQKDTFELVKESKGWMVKNKQNQSDAEQNKIQALLTVMSPLKPLRVAGNSKKNWDKFGVNDKAVTVQFNNGNKTLAKIYIGKVDYQAPKVDKQNPYSRGMQGNMIGYVRTEGDDNVYVVDGYLKLSYVGDANSFKKKDLINEDPKTINEVSIKNGNESFTLSKKKNYWVMGYEPADSAKSVKYINNIVRLRGYDFLDKDAIKGIRQVGSVTIKSGDNEIVKIDAYPVDSVTYALVSSQNYGNIIKDKNHKLFDKLFKNKEYFH